jgi:hypothetical protein
MTGHQLAQEGLLVSVASRPGAVILTYREAKPCCAAARKR